MFKVFLNKKRSKNGINKENNLNISLTNENKILPFSDIVENVNAYEQYIKEKKNSQIYRLSFDITPVCSNVLFNKITEIVYHEGGDDCIVFNAEHPIGDVNKNEKLEEYCGYKKISPNNLKRNDLIKDTGFSHLECGGLVYHCGYDIFNNHTLRKKEFNVVNKLGSEKYSSFNTISDYKRNSQGDFIIGTKNGDKEFYEHLYTNDNIYSFEDSINENLVEKNGWIGFINPNGLNINNYNNVSLNKCMNNNKGCEMIDMYPDRSLFSFIPKVNKYRDNRIEKNWDYCLTYPFENFYDNELVQYQCKNGIKINGLKAKIVDDIFEDDFIDTDDGVIVTLKTIIKNNFNINSLINIVLIGENEKGEEIIEVLDNNEKIARVGMNGKHKEYYFSIYADELFEKLNNFKNPSEVEIRVRKVSNIGLCEYYFRKYKRIPNFNNTNVYNDDIVSNEEIKKYSKKEFNSTINGLGFSRTIYNDRNAQLLFNDDINLKGLKDNLGREISEIYLTIVKNNDGHKEWYEDKDYTNNNITNSRCFGKITSGVEMLDNTVKDFNIHTINNLSTDIITYDSGATWNMLVDFYYQNFFNTTINGDGEKVYTLIKPLEDDINQYGTIVENERNNEFLGDIVELNKGELTEYTLTEVLHRFNTVQREILSDDFKDLIVDEIKYDDFDLESGFSIEEKVYNDVKNDTNTIKIPFNIDPEGYYYKPHYKIQLKEFKKLVKQGEHTRVIVENFTKTGKIDEYNIELNKEYYFNLKDILYFYHKKNDAFFTGLITKKITQPFNGITIKVKLPNNTTISDYHIYKPNSEKPYSAYELNDGSGRYLWRETLEDYEYDVNSEISKYIFTNNAHYINKHILFMLHRQDPSGEFGISNISAPTPIINNFAVEGIVNDYSDYETMFNEIEEGGLLC